MKISLSCCLSPLLAAVVVCEASVYLQPSVFSHTGTFRLEVQPNVLERPVDCRVTVLDAALSAAEAY